jgi:hypothetical protein
MEKKAKELMRNVKNTDFSKLRAAGPPNKTEPSSLNSTPTNSAPSTPNSESAIPFTPSTPPDSSAESPSPNKTKASKSTLVTPGPSKTKKKKKSKGGKKEESPQKEETSSELEEPEVVDFEQEAIDEITKSDRIRYMVRNFTVNYNETAISARAIYVTVC